MFFRLLSLVLLPIILNPSHAEAADRGPQLYRLCTSCHGANGEGYQKIGAPSIAGLPAWYVEAQLNKYKDGVRGLHPSDRTGMRMRPMARALIKENDYKQVAAFVSALPRPIAKPTIKGSIVKGETKYNEICVTCHGAQGEGNQVLGAPPLARASDWYLRAQLHNFKSGIRGVDPRDTSGMSMRPMAMQLSEEDMDNVVSYISVFSRFEEK